MAVDFDEAKVNRAGMSLIWTWGLATMVGMILGYLPSALFVDQLELGFARIIVPLFAGILIGLFQWFVLRRYIHDTGDWVWNMIGSWVIAYTVGLFVVSFFGGSFLSVLVAYLLFGLIVSLIQWPVLRREIPNIWNWVLSNVVGWTIAAILAYLVLRFLSLSDATPSLLVTTLINSTITGLVAGLVTGASLYALTRQPDAADMVR
jgi:hypothetical protein